MGPLGQRGVSLAVDEEDTHTAGHKGADPTAHLRRRTVEAEAKGEGLADAGQRAGDPASCEAGRDGGEVDLAGQEALPDRRREQLAAIEGAWAHALAHGDCQALT